jgi:hypothetical protein
MIEGRFQAWLLYRLGQVIEGMDFEGTHGVLVVRGYEDGRRHPCNPDLFYNLKAAIARHLNVEKEQVNGFRLKQQDKLPAIAALARYFDGSLSGEHGSEPVPGERLVVGDHSSKSHAVCS